MSSPFAGRECLHAIPGPDVQRPGLDVSKKAGDYGFRLTDVNVGFTLARLRLREYVAITGVGRVLPV